jgi:hypothetical protein
MNEVLRFRSAKPSDARQIAHVLIRTFGNRDEEFMLKLGTPFLTAYLRVVLNEAAHVGLCAVDDAGRIVGVELGTLDAGAELRALRRNWYRLASGAVSGLIRRPSLVPGLWRRFRDTSDHRKARRYVVSSGARSGYWAMLPSLRHGAAALELHQRFLRMMKLLGASVVAFDVAAHNSGVIDLHRRLGARITEELSLPDGRRRVRMAYCFDTSDDSEKMSVADSLGG